MYNLNSNMLILFHKHSGFGFSDKPQPGYGFDYTFDGKLHYKLLCKFIFLSSINFP